MMIMSLKKIKKGDYVVAAGVLLLVGALLLINRYMMVLQPAGGHASVEVENEFVTDVSLQEGAPRYTPISLPRGEALLEVEEGKIRVLPMPREICPLNICSSVGWIDKPGQAIICLPNRMIITVSGEEEDPLDLDGVTN